jgi:hypothetical protein
MLYVDAVEGTEPAWIGLHDMYNTFHWSDESNFGFTQWDRGQPQNEGIDPVGGTGETVPVLLKNNSLKNIYI